MLGFCSEWFMNPDGVVEVGLEQRIVENTAACAAISNFECAAKSFFVSLAQVLQVDAIA